MFKVFSCIAWWCVNRIDCFGCLDDLQVFPYENFIYVYLIKLNFRAKWHSRF
jgi:hypothetical protein